MSYTVQSGGNEPDIIVDLANVCRDEELKGGRDNPRWQSVHEVLDAWCRYSGTTTVRLTAVADANLRCQLSESAAARYDAWEAEGIIRTRPNADPEILELAEGCPGARIVTKDHFVDHRLTHPWLNTGNYEILRWRLVGQRCEIEPRRLNWRTGLTVDTKEWQKELSRLGNNPDRVLGFWWRCDKPAPGCAWADSEHVLQVPRWRPADDTVLCPSCHRQLTRLSPRPRSLTVKISPAADNGAEPLRVVLADGDQIVLGRASGKDVRRDARGRKVGAFGLDQLDPAPAGLPLVSRQHVLLSCRAGAGMLTVHAEDLGSTNGSVLVWFDNKTRQFQRPVPLRPGAEARLYPRDQLLLAGAVKVEISGRQWDYGAEVRYDDIDMWSEMIQTFDRVTGHATRLDLEAHRRAE